MIDLSNKKKIAFVCSGGVVKAAAFHMGVAAGLSRFGFRFIGGLLSDSQVESIAPSQAIQVYVGSSAGSLVSTYLAQGGSIKELEKSFIRGRNAKEGAEGLRYWEMLFPKIQSLSDFIGPLSKLARLKDFSSPFGTEGIVRYLREKVILSDSFTDLRADLFLVATELNQPRKVVFSRYLSAPKKKFHEFRNDVGVSDACAASMSLPPLYHPYKIMIEGEEREFFDGEIKEPLSSHIAREMNCDLIICSYTYQPLRYLKSKGSLSKRGLIFVSLQAIYQMIEQKIEAARETRQREKELINSVKRFCEERGFEQKIIDDLVEEIEARTTYKSNVDYIYIHPKDSDEEMFSMPHFSLRPKTLDHAYRRGLVASLNALKENLKTF